MKELETLDFESIAKRLRLSQYKDLPNFDSLYKIVSDIFTDIQEDNFSLRDKFWLQDATGEQLDFIGNLWGEERKGQTDDDYRARIYQKISLTASGTISEIKSYLLNTLGATFALYSPEYPAGYRMRTDAILDNRTLESITAAGVQPFLAGRILLGNGGGLRDANGNCIIHVSSTEPSVAEEEGGAALVGEALYGEGLYGGI